MFRGFECRTFPCLPCRTRPVRNYLWRAPPLDPSAADDRTYTALYTDAAAFMADQLRLIHDGRFDYVEGSLVPQEGGGWSFQIELTKYFSSPPNDAAQLAGLLFLGGTLAVVDHTYFDFINRLAPLVATLKQAGVWDLPHPWVNLFLPVPEAQSFISSMVSALTVDDVGQGPVLLYPANRLRVLTPLLRLPDTRDFYLLAILRNAIPPTPSRVSELLQQNRRLFDQCVAVEGKRYPVGWSPWAARIGRDTISLYGVWSRLPNDIFDR